MMYNMQRTYPCATIHSAVYPLVYECLHYCFHTHVRISTVPFRVWKIKHHNIYRCICTLFSPMWESTQHWGKLRLYDSHWVKCTFSKVRIIHFVYSYVRQMYEQNLTNVQKRWINYALHRWCKLELRDVRMAINIVNDSRFVHIAWLWTNRSLCLNYGASHQGCNNWVRWGVSKRIDRLMGNTEPMCTFWNHLNLMRMLVGCWTKTTGVWLHRFLFENKTSPHMWSFHQ